MADYEYIESSGVIVPDTETLLEGVQDDFRAVFGQDMPVDPETPQGVLITMLTAERRGVVENNAELANQINPNLAGGVFLDAIGALTGLERTGATYSTIAGVTVGGVSGTIIPAGYRCSTTNGDEFQTASQVTIGVGGTAEVDFVAVEAGPVSAAANTLDTIVDSVLGWETVDNDNAAVVGVAEESDAAYRLRRKRTLALQGISVSEAITSALYATDGVQSLQYRENTSNVSDTIDGILLVAHSIWVCVNGGTDEDIAETLLREKTAGAAWNGSESVVVEDEASGQAYTVLFDRPVQVPITCRVTVGAGSYTGDLEQAVKEAIVAYADGEVDGEEGFVVGGDVSPFEIAAAVNSEVSGVYVGKVELDYVDTPAGWVTEELAIAIDEIATITENAIIVVQV